MRRFVVENFKPLGPDTDLSISTWLDSTDYPEWRKQQLREAADSLGGETPSGPDLVCKSFMKKEHYWNCYKYPRAIKSRTDRAKVFVGPAFKAIESVVFQHPSFIKHISVKDRPKYISDKLARWGHWYQTDYTSFEASFCPDFLRVCEIVLYSHMLVHFPELARFISQMLSGRNKCHFRHATVSVDGRRMSGEMCTSLGNGFTNLVLFLFLVSEKNGRCDGVVEGDDGLFGCTVSLSAADFAQLGFIIKIDELDELLKGSFCGLMMTRKLTSMTDPRKVLLRFGVSLSPVALGSRNARRGLLRAKALSLLYEHPRCPILTALASRYVALTEGVAAIFDRSYKQAGLLQEMERNQDWLRRQLELGIDDEIRQDFSDTYGIEPHIQLRLEALFATSGEEELDDPVLDSLYEPGFVGRDYYAKYVSRLHREYDDVLATEPVERSDNLSGPAGSSD